MWLLSLSQLYFIIQVAELYEDLKKRVAQFNMPVPDDTQPSDYTHVHRQKFILQVGFSAVHN